VVLGLTCLSTLIQLNRASDGSGKSHLTISSLSIQPEACGAQGAASALNMKLTLQDRLLYREQGDHSRYTSVKGLYGQRKWVRDLDIVNELGGHSGCVNALRQVYFCWVRLQPIMLTITA
jgi:hypothetical protein